MASIRHTHSKRHPGLGSPARRGAHGLTLAAIAAVALSGCGAQEDVSFTCGPEEEPRKCGWQETRRANAAFDEVEERYRAIRKVTDSSLENPGVEQDWDAVRAYAVDPFLQESRQMSEEFHEAGQYLDGVVPITSIERLSYSETSLQVAICGDATDVAARSAHTHEVLEYGEVTRLLVRAEKVDHEWVISSAENVEPEECGAE